jgi:16S rRNA (adenine1518-N6/adenine1519-N6)-dimethyltransferase
MTLLGAAEIRELAAALELKPSKSLGQNFVHDANTCRKIAVSYTHLRAHETG